MCDPSAWVWIYSTTEAHIGHVQGDPKLDIHLFSDTNQCVVSSVNESRRLVTVMAVGTDPRARAALDPHENENYCELLEHRR